MAQKFALIYSLLQDLLKSQRELRGGDEHLLSIDFHMTLAFAIKQSADAIHKARKACGYRNGKVRLAASEMSIA